jgi:AraC-like DNA-binding protein
MISTNFEGVGREPDDAPDAREPIHYDTESRPPLERFDWWCDLMQREHPLALISSEQRADFRASMSRIAAGGLRISRLSLPALDLWRGPTQIRRSDPDVYTLTLMVSGRLEVHHLGGRESVRTGEFVVCSSSQPLRLLVRPGAWQAAVAVILQLPKNSLPLRERHLHEVLGVPLTGSGVCGMTGGYLAHLGRELGQLAGRDARRLAIIAGELATATVAHVLEQRLGTSNPRMLMLRMLGYIDRHLEDPGLCPQAIASAHHISVRYLHKVFHDHGWTAGSWIRHRRLERCRRDLCEPAMRTLPVRAIAVRWGFGCAEHFSRAFSEQFGMPPAAYRSRYGKPPPADALSVIGSALTTNDG